MGKNEGHKAAQALKAAAPDDPTPGNADADGYDATFHTPAWHEARLSALNEPVRVTLEEFKEKKAEDEEKLAVLKRIQDKADQEYRLAMDKERARIMSGGKDKGDASKKRDKSDKRDKGDKHKKEKSEKSDKKKHKKEGKEKSRSKSSSSKRKRHDSSSDSGSPTPKRRH